MGMNVVFALAYPSRPAIATVLLTYGLPGILASRTANSSEGDVLGCGSGLGLELGLGLGRGLDVGLGLALAEAVAVALGVATAADGDAVW
jgi:hypothetical protein